LRFTVRRPPSGEVSPCCHRPSGGDVACSVDVGIAPTGIAGFALEDRLALAVSGCENMSGGLAARLPVLLLLHRQIPHIPRIPAVRQQPLLLLSSRQPSKPRHIRTVATNTDKPRPSTPAPLEIDDLPRLKTGVSSRRRLR